MCNTLIPLRLGHTAIAAVLALSSTPLLAQVAAPQAEAPVIAAPPAPTIAPAEAAPAPAEATAAAPQASLATAASAPIVASGAVASNGTTIGTPVVHGADSVADEPVTIARRPAARATMTPAAAPAAAVPAAMAAATPTPAPVVREAAPAPRVETPAPVATTSMSTSVRSDDTAEWIGAGALGFILLAGGAFAVSRRRREDRDDEVYELSEAEAVAAAPIATPAYAAPVFARSEAEPAALPADFDLSRFGRHVQQAYRGPTADNPSLSLKKRLHRAAFFDQREREGMDTGIVLPAEPMAETAPSRLEAPVLRGQTARDEQIVIRPAKRPVRASFRPAFQN